MKRCLVVACGVVAGLGCAAAVAQPGAPEARPAGAAQESATATAERAAREVARMAAIDLLVTGATDPRDFRVAAVLLDVAHRLAPKDEAVLRLLIDASSMAGDREGMLRATQTLVKTIDPADTVAWLRLISGGISSQQDVESRLAAYEKFLAYKDPSGNMIDPSIRSRLALDAALLLRERGDLRGFADKLAIATELDPTNKDAASLAVTFYTENGGEAIGRLTLLISLLKADPFDPETHLAIARELSAGDAVSQASRFYQTHDQLRYIRREEVPEHVSAEENTLFWCDQGADQLVNRLRARVQEERSRAEAALAMALREDVPQEQRPNPEMVRLTPELERVRLAAALASGDQGQISFAYAEAARTFELNMQRLQAAKTKTDIRTQDLEDEIQRLRGQWMWMQLWAGRDLDAAEATITAFKDSPDVQAVQGSGAALARMEGWLRLQRNDLDGAEAALRPLAASDVLARLGMCVLEEKRGRKDQAAAAYEALAREAGGSVAGAYARSRYKAVTGSELARGPLASKLEALGRGVPGWLEELIKDPRRVSALQAEPVPTSIGAMDPVRVQVRLRNVSPIPLALGPERPLNSRVLLVPELTVVLDSVPGSVVVVRMDRRLRLLPQEEVVVDVWGDQGNMGWVMNHLITAPTRVKWKVIQGFMLTNDQIYMPGPMCVDLETGSVERAASTKAFDPPDVAARWLESGTTEDVAEVLMLMQINARVDAGVGGAWPADQREMLGRALAARYPQLDIPTRVMVAAMLPLKSRAAWLAPAEEVIALDADPLVKRVVMALRTSKADDARLDAAIGSSDAELAELARLIQSRILAGVPTYATIGDGAPVEQAPPEQAPAPEAGTTPASSSPVPKPSGAP